MRLHSRGYLGKLQFEFLPLADVIRALTYGQKKCFDIRVDLGKRLERIPEEMYIPELDIELNQRRERET